jgi:hypothetical protein
MRKTILTSILMTLIICANAQKSNTTAYENKNIAENLAIKANKQKTAAWICLASGAALITTGMIIAAPKASEDWVYMVTLSNQPQHDYTAETVLTVIGAAAIITSVPLFISAGNNKRKAKLMLTEQKTATGLPLAVPKKIPSLTLSFPIGS